MITIEEAYNLSNQDNKSLIVRLRSDKYGTITDLINKTSYLPENVSISERAWCWINKVSNETYKEICCCPYCGNHRRFRKMNKGYFATCGNKECKGKGIAKGVDKHDFDEIQKKMRATYKARTGYEHNMQNPEARKAFFDKYEQEHDGERYAIASKRSKETREKNCLEKYGTINALHSDKAMQTIVKKYGSYKNKCLYTARKAAANQRQTKLNQLIERIEIMGYDYISHNDDNDEFTIKCCRCGHQMTVARGLLNVKFNSNDHNFCFKCDYKNMTYRSKFEMDVLEYVREILSDTTYEIKTNRRINGVEVDIFIPDLKIAIECNGVYYHSENFKTKNAHFDKKKIIEDAGYNLIYIWEDTWNNASKREIILSRLRIKLGKAQKLYARNCELIKITYKDCEDFLTHNHLQGTSRGKYYYGLYYNNELVECIVIGKSRKLISGSTNQLELIRLCTKKNFVVIGGFSKLIKAFRLECNAPIISFADLDWSKMNDCSYLKNGFKLMGYTTPDYWWVIKNIGVRENRMKYTKHSLVAKGYDKNLTEHEIMHSLGNYRVYGSGNIKLILE